MSNWSSYKGQKLLTEGWRSYLKGDLYSGEKVEELFGMGKKKPQVRGTVNNNSLTEVTAWVAQTIQDMRKDPDLPEETRKVLEETDEKKIVEEFYEMITGQQFELMEQQPQAGAFQRDDYRGGIAQTGHVRDPEAEEGEDLPLTFEPDGYENITNFIELIKDKPEHVEKFVTELKRVGFSNCVDTLGCKKPAVEPSNRMARFMYGPGTVGAGGHGAPSGRLTGAGGETAKKKEPQKITTQQGTTAIMLRPDGAVVATDTDGDGKIDDVTPLVDRVLELLRQLCAYVIFPEDQRDQAMQQLEGEVRPALEAAGTDELGQLIKELEQEIAQQGECRLQIGAGPGSGDVKQIGKTQDLEQIIIDYQNSLNRAMEMARTGGIEGFEKDDFDLIYMAMADCNDEDHVKFEEPTESSPIARGKWVNEAVDYDKCKDLKELGASPQFIHLVAKAISGVTDGIEYKEFFLNLPGAEIDDDGGGKGEDDGQGGGEDDGQGGGEDDGQGGGEDDTEVKYEYYLPDDWGRAGNSKRAQERLYDKWKSVAGELAADGASGLQKFKKDLQEFIDIIGPHRDFEMGAPDLSESNRLARNAKKFADGAPGYNADTLYGALRKVKKGTGAFRILHALAKLNPEQTRFVAIHLTPDVGRRKVEAEKDADSAESQTPAKMAAESLLRESTIDRWQQLAGITKRV